MVAALVAAGTLVLGAPVAGADSHNYVGGCALTDVRDAALSGQDTHEGVLRALAVIGHAASPVTDATITCVVKVDGVAAAQGVPIRGRSVLVGASAVTFGASSTSTVEICDRVQANGTASEVCRVHNWPGVAHDDVLETAGAVYRKAGDLVEYVVYNNAEPTLCSVTSRLGGGMSGPVKVGPDGDVYLDGAVLLDCAPYAGPKQKLPPPSGAAGIVISNFGNGVSWQRTGLLATTSLWSCAVGPVSPFTVTCTWVSSATAPNCQSLYSTAAVFLTATSPPTWGKARARALCDFYPLDSAVASASGPFQTVGISPGPTPPVADLLRCRADNGANGPAVPQYVVDCDFQLV